MTDLNYVAWHASKTITREWYYNPHLTKGKTPAELEVERLAFMLKAVLKEGAK